MNLRTILLPILCCTILSSCAPKQEIPQFTPTIVGYDIDPNTETFVTFVLEGQTLPGVPKVVDAQNAVAALFERRGTEYDILQVDENIWFGPFELGQSYVIGWIVEDKKLFGYCSEPFEVTKDLVVNFSPGMPATLEYDLTDIPPGIEVFPAEILLPVKTISNGKETYLSWGINEKLEEPGIVTIPGLADATFQILARNSDYSQLVRSRTPFLYDERDIKIETGITNRIQAKFPVIDKAEEPGDITFRGLIYDTDKKPLSGKVVTVIPAEEDGKMLDLYYPVVKTDSNGIFELKGVIPNKEITVMSDYSGALYPKEVMLENSFVWVELSIDSVSLPITIGSSFEDITIDWKDGNSSSFSDLFGKKLVLCFWATWAEPCQKELSDLNSLAEELSQTNNITFIALNIDPERSIWEDALDAGNLNNLSHAWFDRNKNSYSPNGAIPAVVIIDEEGIIRATGQKLDVKAELEKNFQP